MFTFDTFGFQKGGHLTMSIQDSINSKELWYLDCSESQYEDIKEKELLSLCSDLNSNHSLCLVQHKFSPNITEERTAKKQGYQYFLIVNCGEEREITYTFDYIFVNPNEQYLSLSEIPFPKLFLIFSILWSVLIFFWCINWGFHFKLRIKLHQLLTFVLFTKAIALYLLYFFWSNISQTGIVKNKYVISLATYIAFSEYIFYTSLLLIANGWTITKKYLTKKQHVHIAIPILIIAVSKQLQKVYQLTWVGIMLLFILAITYFYILKLLFESTNNSLHTLQFKLLLLRESGIQPLTTPTYAKFQLFKKYKNSIFYYILLFVAVYGIGVTITRYQWVVEICMLIVDLILYLAIGFTFRLRDQNNLFEEFQTMNRHQNNGYQPIESNYEADYLNETDHEDVDKRIETQSIVYIENIGNGTNVELGQEESKK
ncbi:hypothetical protein M0812_12566 [Anaeramoeba flamelloides]|uniref:GOST seven transmembrane domain-containing protein n=1 Tax=Anaeramoeba flamelloides TaxID=1746091 RepID=A0AAV7ZQW1_9EUKA|nr:hypothetical protein M0812_12566 [Anaeramoeba flamelloides]